MTKGLVDVAIPRPKFNRSFAGHTSSTDNITIRDLWSFCSFLLDFVSESVSVALISGDSSTSNALQQAEEFLVLILPHIPPLLAFYERIAASHIFDHLIGETYGSATSPCKFSSMAEILCDEGGKYVFSFVAEYVSKPPV